MSEIILIINDDASQLRMAEYTIEYKLGYRTMVASSSEAANMALHSKQAMHPDIILLDMSMANNEAFALLKTIRFSYPEIPVIALISFGDHEQLEASMAAGAMDYIDKPIAAERLRLVLRCALKMQRMRNRMAALERRATGHVVFSDIIGQSPPLKASLAQAKELSTSAEAVWIEGGAGTGKELLARAMHGSSDRAGKPFVVVDCPLLAGVNGESMLMGRESISDKLHYVLGHCREAGQGTLFFREIGVLPTLLQQRLLEMVKHRHFMPLGSYSPLPLEARVICSNSKNVSLLVGEGLFNNALYQKMRTHMITMPSLRERKQDIGLLANHFLAAFSASENKYIRELNGDALQLLENMAWPGNIRQLSHLLWRAAILCNQDQLDSGNIRLIQQLAPVQYLSRANTVVGGDIPMLVDMQGHPKKLKSIEEDAIRFALKHAGGCMTRAARTLGIGRSTLYRRMNEMGSGNYISRPNQTTRPMMEMSSGERS